MRTNIVLDDTLVMEAFRLTGLKTKRELILQALKEMVENRQRLDLRELRGIGGFRHDYDHKALRAGEGKP
ncbi:MULTISPECIES: type II toxin-antitoxin system VapB family antitoxin [Thiothrix]|uniref:Type II toxin-antitoxin system VapB family antitoxin n=1 Tax=Thiothrix winogradskyi TaxID=96472 RepID=A0ABY3SUH2_9GAMM|nr:MULTISPECIES: type II toxin-antitoxin system VapB family antitoxin [Thiothrix]QQZ27376.1 type II toxin-antitoxin system VapB family antitoxin [Thiothrix subterranea]UJS23056.1 type II toxin-antitoxin system VapB family antitoxin [Thiothrix winogradskyi]